MFGIDFSEILVIFAIALVVLGPQRLPKLAATIGRWLGRARAMARQFREQLEQEATRIQDSVDVNAARGATGHPPPGPSSTQPAGSQSSAPSTAEPAQPRTEVDAHAASGAGASSAPERIYTIADAGMPEPEPAAHSATPASAKPIEEVHAGLASAPAPGSGEQPTPRPAVPQQPAAVEVNERGV
jgi:sec-independent protein translocase protein TatB